MSGKRVLVSRRFTWPQAQDVSVHVSVRIPFEDFSILSKEQTRALLDGIGKVVASQSPPVASPEEKL